MAIVKDFITKYGIYSQGTSAVTSSTGQVGGLQVDGGAAIAKNLIVGQGSTFWGTGTFQTGLIVNGTTNLNNALTVTGLSTLANVTASGTLYVGGAVTLNSTLGVAGATTLSSTLGVASTTTLTGPLIANTGTFSGPVSVTGNNTFTVGTGATTLGGTLNVAGVASFTNTTAASTSPAGAVVISGGAYVGNNLIVASTASSTGTNTSNALYVAGGAWVDRTLVVTGDAIFRNNVIFQGTTTQVLSSNTYITDNIFDLHVPSSGFNNKWTFDDGKDIGIRFNYYTTTDTNAALVLSNSNKFLEWYSSGAEGTSTFVGTTFGTFRTGSIRLMDSTSATSTNSGALQVVGGIGAGGRIYAGGDISGATITARNLTPGRIVFVGTGSQLVDDVELTYDSVLNLLSADVSNANLASNVKGGGPGQLVYQVATSSTGFVATGTAGFILQANGTAAPSWVPLGGVTAGSATTASNLAAGTVGQVPYQNAVGATSFFGPGTAGQLLVSNGAVSGGPSFVNTGNIFVGSADKSINLFGGAAGRIPIQSGTDATAFIPTGSAGQLLQAQTGNTATFVNTSTLRVGFADNADKWTTARTLTLAGDLGGNVTFDGSTNFTLTATIQPNSVALGTDTTGDYVSNGATSGWGISGSTTGETQTFTVTVNSTSSNTTSTIVYRDASGNFSAGTITAALNGNASTASRWQTARTVTFTGDTTGTFTIDGSADVSNVQLTIQPNSVALGTDTTGDYVSNGATSGWGISGSTSGETQTFTVTVNSTSSNTTSTIVYRNASGNFSANQITANAFIGTATLATTATNLAAGTAGQVPYQSGPGATTFTGPGNAGEVLVSRGTSGPIFQNTLTLSGSNASTSPTTGAFQVAGGAGIGGNLFAGGVIVSQDATNSTSTGTGAIRTLGGVGITKDLTVGGSITVGTASAGSVVPIVYSNNVLLASYTSPAITNTATTNLDVFSSSAYRSAKYTVQIWDNGTTNIHTSELLVTHNGSNAYITEYAIVTNNGPMGTFDATLGGGNVTLTFAANTASSMVVKVVRFGITA